MAPFSGIGAKVAVVSEGYETTRSAGAAERTASDGCITGMKAEAASCSWGPWQRTGEIQIDNKQGQRDEISIQVIEKELDLLYILNQRYYYGRYKYVTYR